MSAPPPERATLSVSPSLLIAAAGRVDDESHILREDFTVSDASIDEAMTGWVGRSHGALANTAVQWVAAGAGLCERLQRLATAVRTAGLTFAQMDTAHAAALSLPPRNGRSE